MEVVQDLEIKSETKKKWKLRKKVKREKKSIKESIGDFLFLLPAYLALILFVFLPIGFALLISFYRNPSALELRNAFLYYSDSNNLSFVSLLSFFYLDEPFDKGIFMIKGLTILLTVIFTVLYSRLAYKRLKIINRFKSKIVRVTITFFFGLLVAPLTLFIFEWIIKSFTFLGTLGIPLDEYRNVLTAPDIDFLRILFNTFFWTLFCTALHVILGIGLAVLLNRKFAGRAIFRSLFILPWAVPSFVSTLMWRSYVFDKDLGVLGSLTTQFGDSAAFTLGNLLSLVIAVIATIVIAVYSYKLLNKQIKIKRNFRPLILVLLGIISILLLLLFNDLLQGTLGRIQEGLLGYRIIDIPQIQSTFWITDNIYIFGYQFKMITFSAILINVWLGVPFMMLSFLATLQSIPNELYEAAEIDGLSSWGQFKKVTLPLLKPTLLTVSLLGIIWTFNLFNVVYLLSQNQTGIGDPVYYDIFVTFIYTRFNPDRQYSQASALSFTVFIILISFSLVYRKFIKTEELWEVET
ncbi:MAG: carbohydrate ABC transporter permease [Promethearchaeota archaeon]